MKTIGEAEGLGGGGRRTGDGVWIDALVVGMGKGGSR